MVDFDISGLGPTSMDLDFEVQGFGSAVILMILQMSGLGFSWFDTISLVWGLEPGAVFCGFWCSRTSDMTRCCCYLLVADLALKRISIDLEGLYVFSPSKACHGPRNIPKGRCMNEWHSIAPCHKHPHNFMLRQWGPKCFTLPQWGPDCFLYIKKVPAVSWYPDGGSELLQITFLRGPTVSLKINGVSTVSCCFHVDQVLHVTLIWS